MIAADRQSNSSPRGEDDCKVARGFYDFPILTAIAGAQNFPERPPVPAGVHGAYGRPDLPECGPI